MKFSKSESSGSAMPEILEGRLAKGGVKELDVRPLLEKGQEPFGAIMRTVGELNGGQVFKLIAPFEPAPLYAVLGGKGFAHWSTCTGEGMWEIFFYRAEEEIEEETSGEENFSGDDSDETIIALDVRGLEPPEPLERVMEAAERLSYGDVLKVRHHREPLILFDVLAERGFAHRSEQRDPDDWEIRIWRKS